MIRFSPAPTIATKIPIHCIFLLKIQCFGIFVAIVGAGENLIISFDRARRSVPGKLVTIFGTRSWTNMDYFYSNVVLTSPMSTIEYIGFTELNHPAYFQDLAPSDYHLFSNLKNFPRSRNSESDDDRKSLFGES